MRRQSLSRQNMRSMTSRCVIGLDLEGMKPLAGRVVGDHGLGAAVAQELAEPVAIESRVSGYLDLVSAMITRPRSRADRPTARRNIPAHRFA